jgi:prepilin-type N-terminal cleavage/methylation domain-containing protein
MADRKLQTLTGTRQHRRGMTLIELLLAMMVTAMVMAGVATMAYALSSVRNASDETSSKQACVRFALTQLGELLRHARLVCYASDSQVLVWTADTNGDRQMNITEMACIATDTSRSSITLTRLASAANTAVPLSSAGEQASQWWLAYGGTATTTTVVQECTGVMFAADTSAPATRHVSFVFAVVQDGETIGYSVSGYLQGRTGNVLSEGNNLVSDDD